MAKFAIYGKVVGTKYLGEFEAKSAEDAITQAEANSDTYVALCHQCSSQCEDPEVVEMTAEKASE